MVNKGASTKKRTPKASAFSIHINLLCKAGVDQLYKTLDRVDLIGTVSKDPDGSTADDAERQNAKERLRVNLSLILFYPNRGLILISLLNEESCGTGVQACFILDQNFLNVHNVTLTCRLKNTVLQLLLFYYILEISVGQWAKIIFVLIYNWRKTKNFIIVQNNQRVDNYLAKTTFAARFRRLFV